MIESTVGQRGAPAGAVAYSASKAGMLCPAEQTFVQSAANVRNPPFASNTAPFINGNYGLSVVIWNSLHKGPLSGTQTSFAKPTICA